MSTPPLSAQLGIGTVADSDLAHAVAEFFNLAQQDGDDVVYIRPPDPWALRLHYRGDQLVGADAGPGLRPDVLEQLLSRVKEFQAPQQQLIGRTILFSSVPVNGSCRVERVLQILPPPAEAPRPPFAMADHPFILEFPFHDSAIPWIGSFRYARAAADLTLVLNAVLWPAITSVDGHTHRWTFVPGSVPSEVRSEFLQEGYSAPGFVGRAAAFSNSNGFAPMISRRDAVYYSQLGIGPGAELELPESFPRLINGFQQLGASERARFLRAAYWYGQYGRSWHHSISLAYICLICAIEALVPPSTPNPPCTSCGRDTGAGPTQRFAEFVEGMVPGLSEQDRLSARELYRVRSKLAHGGTLLRLDVEREAFLHPARSGEYALVQGAGQIARLLLVNWLATRSLDRIDAK